MIKLKFKLLSLLLTIVIASSAKEYHVSVNGNDQNEGSALKPFRTINYAAQLAVSGDVITVHSGTYRERIDPAHGGESDTKRIIYRAAPGEKVEIKGSEVITGWKKEKNGVWKVVISNSFFGDYNPYKDSINGDWFDRRGQIHHTGEVFLNGKSLYEKEIMDLVINPVANTKIKDPEGSTYTWYCESDHANTTIYANFHKFDPNKELVEISARPTVFYPSKPGINYITINGFHISQAATQWGAPTAEQVGMIATHWNKGWIIENNVISDSKCSGITLGKERGTGHNVWSNDKENVNRDGNIENNHIYNIWKKRQFSGAEIGGIKFHAAIDTQIRKNRIHDCGRGLWLDWMTQGTRVSGNLFYGNDMEDIFLEVNHGPFIVDNNILLSAVSIRTQSEGGAYLHNLVAGAVHMWPDLNRFTPYFLPHSTNMAALTTIISGDDRFYNNIFIGKGDKTSAESKSKYGLEGYNEAKLPVWMSGNIYFYGAKPSTRDVNFANNSAFNPEVRLVTEGASCYLQLNLGSELYDRKVRMITTEILGKAKIPKAAFDNPDGTSMKLDADYFGVKRSETNPSVGPFENPAKGELKLKVW